ncbi:hypothetical protein CROQUDRAFT_716078, partial [Cronartium quercuum f. sp. fusiforme G11]
MPSPNSLLPHFAPRRPPTSSRHSKLAIPSPLKPFLSVIRIIIDNRPRKFQHLPKPPIKQWHLESSHTIPTKWGLYRNLIRYSRMMDQILQKPSDIITQKIKSEFERSKSERSVSEIQERLREGYLLLNKLISAKEGNKVNLEELSEYCHQIIKTAHRESWAKVYRSQLEARNKRPPKPIMTGRFLRPTILNGPLPRYANQPLHITMMISSRRKARERRLIEERKIKEQIEMMEEEINPSPDIQFYKTRLSQIRECFVRERKRERQVYSRKMLDEIEFARRRRPVDLRKRKVYQRLRRRMDELTAASMPEEGSEELRKEMEFWNS